MAVYVVLDEGATLCVWAPPSLQEVKTYCVPVAPLCGEVVPTL